MRRLLLVEDDPYRKRTFRSWLSGFRVVVATSAGAAIGIIRRDRDSYAGVLLDHDLQARKLTSSDDYLCGRDVALAIMENFSRDVMILVHSVNESGSRAIAEQLRQAGFDVMQAPMNQLTQEKLNVWLEELEGEDS